MDLASTIQSLIGSNLGIGSTGGVAPVATPTVSTALTPTVPITNDYVKSAYQSLIPYYTKLLQENGNDVNLAISRLKEDYTTGVRYTTQDVATQTTQTKEDLDAAMAKLGITFPQEQASLQDANNKRGIAVTQNADGSTGYAGGGQAGTELGRLNSDQSLRKEAVQRTAQRSLLGIGTTGQRALDTAGQTLTRGTQDAVRGQQQYGETTQQNIEQQALSMGGIAQGDKTASDLAALNSGKNISNLGGGSPLAGASVADRQAAWTAGGNTGDLPVGWNN